MEVNEMLDCINEMIQIQEKFKSEESVKEQESKRIVLTDKVMNNFSLSIFPDIAVKLANRFMFLDRGFGRVDIFQDVLKIDEVSFQLLSKNDKETILNYLFDYAEKQPFSERYWEDIFREELGRIKNRVKNVTKGIVKKEYLSQKDEDYIYSLYLKIAHYSISHTFGLIDYEEMVLLSLPIALEIFQNPYIDYNVEEQFSQFIVETLRRDVSNETKDVIKEMFHDWYQKNNYSFVQDRDNKNIWTFENECFLLTVEQKRTYLTNFIKKNEKEFITHSFRSKAQNKYNKGFLRELRALKERLEKAESILNSI